MKNVLYCGLTAIALGLATVAEAAADHTWVSRNGLDTNVNCPVTAPCRSLATAHTNTNPGGTISILDSGDYSALIITKAITIKAAAGVDATITGRVLFNSVYSNIIISAVGNDVVVLEGLTMDGGPDGNFDGVSGVALSSGVAVYVINCTIKNDRAGVVNLSSTPNARAFVQRSNLLRNGYGVGVANFAGSGTPVVSVIDSLIDGSTIAGVLVNTDTIIGMARTVINAGPVAILTVDNGQVISIGPSNIVSGSGNFSATLPFK